MTSFYECTRTHAFLSWDYMWNVLCTHLFSLLCTLANATYGRIEETIAEQQYCSFSTSKCSQWKQKDWRQIALLPIQRLSTRWHWFMLLWFALRIQNVPSYGWLLYWSATVSRVLPPAAPFFLSINWFDNAIYCHFKLGRSGLGRLFPSTSFTWPDVTNGAAVERFFLPNFFLAIFFIF